MTKSPKKSKKKAQSPLTDRIPVEREHPDGAAGEEAIAPSHAKKPGRSDGRLTENRKGNRTKKKSPPVRSGKEEKLFKNLLKGVEQFMGGKGFIPLTQEELMQRLSLPAQHKELFGEVLRHLLSLDLIEKNEDRYTWRHSRHDIVKGTLRMHPRGFGFVQPDHLMLYAQDIFIPKHLTKNAVDGDRVEVLVNQESPSEKGPEGKIIAILSRSRTHMAGIIRRIDPQGALIAYAPLLGIQQRIVVEPISDLPLHPGDRVVMEVLDWGSKDSETLCRFSHYLGHISDPACDIYAAIEEFELRSDFPTEAVEESRKFGSRVALKELKQREDLRNLTTLTIDPDSAKDFDDALSLVRDGEGAYCLGVHIADVSHYVRPGTALDEEARLRGNSVYFPRHCLPMLPSSLSEHLCSLKPRVNRLAASVLMRFDAEGNLLDYRITRSVIRSSKRFTYKEAKQVLEGKKRDPHAATLALMVELCHLLKNKRFERGSLELSIPELVLLIDERGMPYETESVAYDITHQLVEEFMLKANETVARHLSLQGKNLPYRIHDEPAEENLRDFSLLAGAFGFRLSERPTPQDLQKLFEEAAGTPYANYLASSYIRCMRLATYSAENIGHYGLSLLHYCHFTSPIRRYVDLILHRILFGGSDDVEELEKIAHQCSEQERISAKAENRVLLLKKLRLLDKLHKEDPHRVHEAIITRVKSFGLYFEVSNLLVEGFIHISDLADDYFVFDEGRMRLKGRSTRLIYAPGGRLKVVLKEVDLITQESKWYTQTN